MAKESVIWESESFTTCCGFGDIFLLLRDLEVRCRPNLILPQTYYAQGVPELLKLLVPKVRFKFKKWYADHCVNLKGVHVAEVDRSNCLDRLPLSDEAIAKIMPYESEEPYIIIHPVSDGKERHYHQWDKIDLNGINYKIVGYPSDKLPIPGKVVEGNFLDTCRLLRGSRGMFGVDSCVMHLANALKVPSVIIYINKEHSKLAPNCGDAVYFNTDPAIISEKVRRLYSGDYSDYIEKRKKKEALKAELQTKGIADLYRSL